MAGLAEDTIEVSTTGARWRGALIAVVLLGLVVAAGMAIKRWVATDAHPKRQVAKIAILPDTPPPPPPPPPKEEPKPQQRDDKPPPPDAAPKPQQAPAPANAPIKMEGAAGDGPSAFAAGGVTNEYKGGPVATTGPAGGTGVTSDRAQDRFYAQSTRQMLQSEIERFLRPEAGELVASFALWVDRQGVITRYELLPGGTPAQEADLRQALDQASRSLRLPAPPASLGWPMRFRLQVRA